MYSQICRICATPTHTHQYQLKNISESWGFQESGLNGNFQLSGFYFQNIWRTIGRRTI